MTVLLLFSFDDIGRPYSWAYLGCVCVALRCMCGGYVDPVLDFGTA